MGVPHPLEPSAPPAWLLLFDPVCGFLRYAPQLLMDLLREPHGAAHPDKRSVSVVDAIVPSLLSCSLA